MNFVADARLPGCALMVWGARTTPAAGWGRWEQKSASSRAGSGEPGDPEPRSGTGTRYLPAEQGVVRGGGVVWRRGQRQQRQQGLAWGLPAGQPREQRSGGGLGRGQQHGRGRDPGAQPEQPGRTGDHPDPGRRRRVRIHRPE